MTSSNIATTDKKKRQHQQQYLMMRTGVWLSAARRLSRSVASSRTRTTTSRWNVSSSVAVRPMASLSGGQAIAQLAEELPFVDVVRYEHKNLKWTLHHVNQYAEALATGFLEQGLQPGDVVLSWLPLHFAEQVHTHTIPIVLLDCHIALPNFLTNSCFFVPFGGLAAHSSICLFQGRSSSLSFGSRSGNDGSGGSQGRFGQGFGVDRGQHFGHAGGRKRCQLRKAVRTSHSGAANL